MLNDNGLDDKDEFQKDFGPSLTHEVLHAYYRFRFMQRWKLAEDVVVNDFLKEGETNVQSG